MLECKQSVDMLEATAVLVLIAYRILQRLELKASKPHVFIGLTQHLNEGII